MTCSCRKHAWDPKCPVHGKYAGELVGFMNYLTGEITPATEEEKLQWQQNQPPAS